MYVMYVCVRTHVFMYVYVYICMYVCMCMYVCICVCMCVCMYVCVCTHARTSVCVNVCMYECVCVFVSAHDKHHTNLHILMHTGKDYTFTYVHTQTPPTHPLPHNRHTGRGEG